MAMVSPLCSEAVQPSLKRYGRLMPAKFAAASTAQCSTVHVRDVNPLTAMRGCQDRRFIGDEVWCPGTVTRGISRGAPRPDGKAHPAILVQPCRLTMELIQIGAKGDVQPFETGSPDRSPTSRRSRWPARGARGSGCRWPQACCSSSTALRACVCHLRFDATQQRREVEPVRTLPDPLGGEVPAGAGRPAVVRGHPALAQRLLVGVLPTT